MKTRTWACVLVAVSVLLTQTDQGLGAAFIWRDFGAGPDGDGMGLASPVPGGSAAGANTFFRWEQATITYSFDASFTKWYGAAGQAAVNAAFATWNAAVGFGLNPGNDISAPTAPTDVRIRNTSVDLQSVALHEIGHVLGSDHPDVAALVNPNTTAGFNNPPVNKNYDIAGGAWVVSQPLNGHPVMYSLITEHIRRRELTDDDLYWVQFLYDDTAVPGPGTGGIGGPVFGDGAVAFTFSEVPMNGNVIIYAAPLPPGTLAATGVTTAPKAARTYYNASAASITFYIPEPTALLVFMVGCIISGLRRARL